jgi:hypothetical protein
VDSATLPGGSRVLAANPNLTGVFDLLMCFVGEAGATLSSPQKADHAAVSGSINSYFSYIVVRDHALGDAREGLLRRVQLWYTLTGLEAAGGYNDDASTGYADGVLVGVAQGGSRTTGAITLATAAGGASAGRAPVGWDVTLQAERARVVVYLGNDCTDFALHGIKLSFREGQRAY